MPVSNTADVIIIGGGVAGLSTAMQLAGRGARVIVLERDRLGNGSTGRAAGLLGQLRGNVEHTRMLVDGLAIVHELEKLAAVDVFVQTGSMRIAANADRAAEIAALVEMGKSIGFDIDHMSIAEVARHLPYMRTQRPCGRVLLPDRRPLAASRTHWRLCESRPSTRRALRNEYAGDRRDARIGPRSRRANGHR